jgi:hypothetical protein
MQMHCERFVFRNFDNVLSQSDSLDRSRLPEKRFLEDAATLVTCTRTYPRFMSAQVVSREEMGRSHKFPS